MIERSPPLPSALARQTRFLRLGSHNVPTLLAHPDWSTPVPTVLWMHGRTVTKELDNGRYLRWIRAGIAACAIDLPGHGERADPALQQPEASLDVLAQALTEIDSIIDALADPAFAGAFDLDRLAIGGMSLGGMITLRRLCDPHHFRCASVECTAGNLALLYHPDTTRSRPRTHPAEKIARVDPMEKLDSWRPIPLLALHSETDSIVPVACIRTFIDALKPRYAAPAADPSSLQLHTWPTTGAPFEHNGFGRVANEAKTMQLEFLRAHLGLQ